ncbi:hypothetical protein PFISCL1PPCAC_20973, partial [Pristionchus fissidentatus]
PYTFRHEFADISKLGESGQYSTFHVIADLSWRISIRYETSERTGNAKKLGLFMYANDGDETNEVWSCLHESTMQLVNQVDETRSIEFKLSNNHPFKHGIPGWGKYEV